jgi:hypothetical protein
MINVIGHHSLIIDLYDLAYDFNQVTRFKSTGGNFEATFFILQPLIDLEPADAAQVVPAGMEEHVDDKALGALAVRGLARAEFLVNIDQ